MAGLYIHIPFCKQACYYCDFHFSTNLKYQSKMVDTICKEISWQKSYLSHEKIESIYFGGGTPSILSNHEIENLLETVRLNYQIIENPEITLEANPDDLSLDKLIDLKTIGINRLSIGIQSFHDKILTFLHRAHTSEEAIECIENARTAGFDILSIDLIFSIPGQNLQILENDIKMAMVLNPEHLSVYSLTIEDKTVFGNWFKKGKLVQLPEDESAKQFDLIIARLQENGYEQYEISNFCRDGYYAKHNTSYWKNTPYLGVGPGAHSFNRKSRQYNISNNHKYMRSIDKELIPFELEVLDSKALANEFLLTSLRTKWGCDLKKLIREFQYDLESNIKSKPWLKEGYLELKDDTLFLTRKGKFVADEIIADLFWI